MTDSILTINKDINPSDKNEPIIEEISPGGSFEVLPLPDKPDKPDKSKNLLDRIAAKATDFVRQDGGKARKEAEIEAIDRKAADDKARLNREIFRIDSDAIASAKLRDPATIQANAQAEKIYKARIKEAKKLVAINVRAEDDLRRGKLADGSKLADDDPRVSHYMGMLDRSELTGTLFSSSPILRGTERK